MVVSVVEDVVLIGSLEIWSFFLLYKLLEFIMVSLEYEVVKFFY